MKLTPLGVNGLCGSYGRQTMSFMITEEDNQVTFLDAGSGLWRLFDPQIQDLLPRASFWNIILTHYHADHVIGLYSLIESSNGHGLVLHAPELPIVDAYAWQAIPSFLGPPYMSAPLYHRMNMLKYNNSHLLSSSCPMSISVRRNKHPGGSVGMRLKSRSGKGDITYVTDTSVDQKVAVFAENTDLLLHEVWLTDEEAKERPREASNHSYVSGVADIAKRAKAKRLMPIHHHPSRSPDDIKKIVRDLQKKVGKKTEVLYPNEGIAISL